jgi:hypothetical protein
MTSVPAPKLRWLTAAGQALALMPLVPLAALARDPRAAIADPSRPPSPSMQASLDGTHYEAVPIKRWRRDAATGRMRWVSVPPAEYKSVRWSFAAPLPQAPALPTTLADSMASPHAVKPPEP